MERGIQFAKPVEYSLYEDNK